MVAGGGWWVTPGVPLINFVLKPDRRWEVRGPTDYREETDSDYVQPASLLDLVLARSVLGVEG